MVYGKMFQKKTKHGGCFMKSSASKMMICMVLTIVLVAAFAAPALATSPIAGGADVSELPDGISITVTDIYSASSAETAARQIGLTSNQYIAGLFDISPSAQLADGSYVVSIPLAGIGSTMTVYNGTGGGGGAALPISYSAGGSYEVSIPLAGINSTVTVYHGTGGGGWIALPTSYSNGVVTATTTNFSPFAIVVTNSGASSAVLPKGTVYYDMVEGAPGASHTLSAATEVAVGETLNNGYTKITIVTTTYLVKTSVLSGGAVTTTTSTAPKTGGAEDMGALFVVMLIIGAVGIICAGRKAVKAEKQEIH
jgi:hypothetical protein